jgi:hypothetical protein
LAFSNTTIGAEYSGSKRDLDTIRRIQQNADTYVSDRSILWIEKGYLSKSNVKRLHKKIDNSIHEIEDFIGIKYDIDAYKTDKIEYFIHSRHEPSHTITAYQPRKFMHPVIFLTFASEKKAPFVHETVHIIAWDWHTLWLKEGLAIFLNDKLGGYPSFPNFGKNIDKLAKSNLRFPSIIAKIGQDGIAKFSNREERRIFYLLSGSFVKFIYDNIGMEKLMKIYREKNTSNAVKELTGKKLDVWKKEWIDSIK